MLCQKENSQFLNSVPARQDIKPRPAYVSGISWIFKRAIKLQVFIVFFLRKQAYPITVKFFRQMVG